MSAPIRLFDLFGEPPASAAEVWTQRIQPVTGVNFSNDPTSITTWLAALNNVVGVTDVRTGADGDRVAVEAKLFMPGSPAYPDGFPFVFASMPDIELRIRPDTLHQNDIQLFLSMSDRGVEILLERLPVEIRLPPGFIDPHPKPGGDVPDGTATYEIGEFRPGHLDDLMVRFDRGKPASIFVHVRLHMSEQGEFSLRTPVPVSFGRCVFSGIPVVAIHDFQLLPSPTIAPRELHWLRHEVTPWAPELTGPLDGSFSIRSLQIDPETLPVADLARFLNATKGPDPHPVPPGPTTPPSSTTDPTAEFVLDDLVVPFFSPWVLPIPRHVSIGVRRRIIDANDPAQVFKFDEAPVRTFFTRSPETGLIVNSLFFKSLPSGVGLTFDMAFVFGNTSDVNRKSEAMALGIELQEDYTLAVSYRREFSTATGLPEPGTGAAQTLNALLHFEIMTNTVDIMTIRLGYSIGRHMAAHLSAADFDDPSEISKALKAAALATVDVFVVAPGTDSIIKLRTLNGETVKFTLEGIGYRFGELHLEGVALPDGVVLLIGSYGIVLQELAVVAEDGATYLSISGGLQVAKPTGFTGSFLLKRLRMRFRGDTGAPRLKLDGLFIRLESGTFLLEAGGFFTETRTGDVVVHEFALTGTAKFKCGKTEYKIGLDVLVGRVRSPALNFEYLFVQAFVTGSFPLGPLTLRGIRALFARNMLPKLEEVDKDSRELRYYNWYKRSDPISVPGDRRLAAWVATDHAIAVGLGASIGLPALGSSAELIAFALYTNEGADESGLLIVAEVHFLENPKPVGFLAVEMDFERDLIRAVLGVELRLSDFKKNAPSWLNRIGVLSGTFFFTNDPLTFALGHLADQRTWFQIQWGQNLFAVRSSFTVAACFEYVEDQLYGFGFVLRGEGGIGGGRVRAEYYAGLGVAFQLLTTGSHDYGLEIFIELGLRIVLFRFLRFGISARAALHMVGDRPTHGELHLEVRLETPWFLPDVTWTVDLPVGGALAVADLGTSTSPLRSAGATQGLEQKSATVHVERFDQGYVDDRPSRTFSVREMRAGGPNEPTRLAQFAADTAVRPIAIDATISVEFAVAVNDQLSLSTGAAPGLGNQKSGDLTLTYDLVGIAVRRRPRFGAPRIWQALDKRVEIPPDFSDPNGVKLSGSFEPSTIQARWDLDAPVDGKPGTQRLLLNSATPFQFATSNPVADEKLIRRAPLWPCCDRKEHQLRTRRLSFEREMVGADLDAPRVFSESTSTLVFNRAAVARPQRAGTSLPATYIVADIGSARRAGVVARMDFDEDVAYCSIRLGWSAAEGRIELVAFDRQGTIAGTRQVVTTSPSDFVTVTVGAQAPIRRVELRLVRPLVSFSAGGFVEIDTVVYTALRDFLDFQREQRLCDDQSDGFHTGYEGKGKLAFLPNHEYEIELTTRITVAHPSAQSESVDVAEYVYFKTKGLPGLNAVQRVGEEVEQYVRGAYGGGRGLLYRREPVVLAFGEDFFVAVPLTLRPAGTAPEHTTLMRMKLLTRADASVSAATPFTSTASDWIVDHRGQGGEDPTLSSWQIVLSTADTLGNAMRTVSPFRERLAVLTQRPTVPCGLRDPRDVIGTTLIAPPQGEKDPDDPNQQLWPAALRHSATVRMEGAPFTERLAFDPADLTAMTFFLDNGLGGSTDWSVGADGTMLTAEGTARRFAVFGDATWNHFTLTVGLTLKGAAAGVAIALPSSGPPLRGLFALVESVSTGRRLVLYRRTTAAEMIELTQAALPAANDPASPLTLQVTAFDDRIRAAVGEQIVEADRDEQREGRVALVASGEAGFRSLSVGGVPIYAFPFSTSRYRSFRDHILSWPEKIDILRPDGLGPGTTSTDVPTLWAATQSDVTAAMQPTADPALRDVVFQRWFKDLGIPLKDEVSRLEISQFVVEGKTAAIILESPEPIDFTSEVTAVLERRVKTGGGVLDPDLVADLNGMQILDVARSGGALDVELSSPTVALPDHRIVFVEPIDGPNRLRVWTGAIKVRRGAAMARVHAVASHEVTVLAPTDPLFRTSLRLGRLVATLPGMTGVIASPIFEFVPVSVRVLESSSARHILLLPMTSTAVPQSLASGTHRLTLTMDRPRWSTTAPADDLNHYRDAATLLFEL